MWRRRIFWQLFGTYGVLIVASLSLLGFLIQARARTHHTADIERELQRLAVLTETLLDSDQARELPHVLAQLHSLNRDLPLRIMLFDRAGAVLRDLGEPIADMENGGDLADVREALQSEKRFHFSHQQVGAREVMILSCRAQTRDAAIAVIRLILPLSPQRQSWLNLEPLVFLVAGTAVVLALVIGFWLTRRMTHALDKLTQGAELIAGGAYGHSLVIEGRDEFWQLAHRFNHMSERLATQFAQLDQDRQQMRTVLSSMVEGVIAIDGGSRVLFANERAGELLEFDPRQAVGQHLWALARQRQLQELVRAGFRAEAPLREELAWSGATPRILLVHAARLPDHRGLILVLYDTTELRRLERVRQEFVANVSHELKTPLAVIQACTETLLDGAIDDLAVRGGFLQRIAEQAQRLHNLIIDLLRLARIESETEVFTRSRLDLDQFIPGCLKQHQTLADARGQKLSAAPPPTEQMPVVAWADEEALRQIVDNLVDNALKYTPEGGAVTVRWGRDGKQVFIEVQDNGIGISETDLPRIFERFYRVDKARSRELGGTGLGLAIVKHLAQAMHGSVQARSQLGAGSNFTVFLPAPKPGQQLAPPSEARRPSVALKDGA